MKELARLWCAVCLGCLLGWGQQACTPTPQWTPCEIVIEMTDADAQAHPNPYLTADVQGEFRSPRARTYMLPAFWDGGRRMVLRFTPDEAGAWTYRVTGNLPSLKPATGQFTVTPRPAAGFIRRANVRHWQNTGDDKPHLWMGDTCYRFASADRAFFDALVAARARQKFTHLRGMLVDWEREPRRAFPDPEYFREVDSRVAALNRAGIVADLILGGDGNQLAAQFPTWQQRERYLRYVVARYAAYNVTWQLVQEFEEYKDGRALTRELGTLLKKLDPYAHPRTTHTLQTSSPLAGDGWMDYLTYQSADNHLGAIEAQIYAMPQVNAEFGYEDSGAGKSHPHHVATDEFRRRLWNATMNGQYPTFGNTGTYGGRKFALDPQYLNSPGAAQMTVWSDVLSRTRYWDLIPYFDVEGGRALALPGLEYLVYLEKPGQVQVDTEKHGYTVYWINPATGEIIKEKKEYKGEKFTGTPPDATHDWLLHLSRDGKKEGMARSYRFEAWDIPMQEVEVSTAKIPFELVEPAAGDIAAGQPVPFKMKLKRETYATRRMMYLLVGEVARDGQAARVIATGAGDTLTVPKGIAATLPAVMMVRVLGMNAAGKVYATQQVFGLK
jgi:hypothetical protein